MKDNWDLHRTDADGMYCEYDCAQCKIEQTYCPTCETYYGRGQYHFSNCKKLEKELLDRQLSFSFITIQERVDRLLKTGVNNPKKWMPIHGYNEPKEEVQDWKQEWERLRKHHLEETNVLFDIIKELSSRIK